MEPTHTPPSVWEQFPSEVQSRLEEDDRVAWRNVCSVLMAIICFGLLLAMLTVFLTTR